jgi:hypothetical protein
VRKFSEVTFGSTKKTMRRARATYTASVAGIFGASDDPDILRSEPILFL